MRQPPSVCAAWLVIGQSLGAQSLAAFVSQVVLRDGMPIDAEVPDYRELDTVPNERRYTADQSVGEAGPADAPSNPPRSPSSASMTPVAAFSKEAPVSRQAAQLPAAAKSLVCSVLKLLHCPC